MAAPPAPVLTSLNASYRPDIDGLRAVAVLAVMVFHYTAPMPLKLLPGGFTGVDVFFVISGFLITSKLYADIEVGEFSVLAFYDRRIRRILPALIVMLAVTLLAGRFLLMPGDYTALATSAATAAFGASNLFFLWNTGYFDQAAELTPLLHTWSLAVEEQFYLVWPLVLFVVARRSSRIDIAAILAGLVIIGFGASLFWFDYDPKAAFFTAVPRAWELALGATLVFLPPLPRAFGEIATVIGLTLIGIGLVAVSESAFPGPSALYPCLGAALVVWPRRTDCTMGRWLGYLSPIGLISYSLYLWHWPVWVFFRFYINSGVPLFREATAAALASVAIATASFFFVEAPFRKPRTSPGRTVGFGLATCFTMFVAAMFVHSKDGLPDRISPDLFAMRSLSVMWEWPCPRVEAVGSPLSCKFGAPWTDDHDKAILWGDSNAEHLAPFIEPLAEQHQLAIGLTVACAPVLDGKSVFYLRIDDNNKRCAEVNAGVLSLLRVDASIKTVILSSSWNVFISAMVGTDREAHFEKSLRTVLAELRQLRKRVVLVTTVPQWHSDPIPCASLSVGLLRRQCRDEDREIPWAQFATDSKVTLGIFAKLQAEFPELEIIRPDKGMCDEKRCISRLNGEFLYRDVAHLRRNLDPSTRLTLARIAGLEAAFSHPR